MMKWVQVKSFPNYEMNDAGELRSIEANARLAPLFIGAEARLGYLMRGEGLGHHLVPLHVLYAENFPEVEINPNAR